MNHKSRRPRSQRAGCKTCKPHKYSPKAATKYRDKRHDDPTSKIKTIKRRKYISEEELATAVRAALDAEPGLDCITLCERLGAELKDVGKCIDRLIDEGRVGYYEDEK